MEKEMMSHDHNTRTLNTSVFLEVRIFEVDSNYETTVVEL